MIAAAGAKHLFSSKVTFNIKAPLTWRSVDNYEVTRGQVSTSMFVVVAVGDATATTATRIPKGRIWFILYSSVQGKYSVSLARPTSRTSRRVVSTHPSF